jgi:hypothetical protein
MILEGWRDAVLSGRYDAVRYDCANTSVAQWINRLATKVRLTDAGAGEPHDGSLAPDPRLPLQPARRLELCDVPPNHTLIEIKPDLNRR